MTLNSKNYKRPFISLEDSIDSRLHRYLCYNFNDWDLRGSLAITLKTLRTAEKILKNLAPAVPEPELVANSDGSIGLCFYGNEIFVMMDVLEERWWATVCSPGFRWKNEIRYYKPTIDTSIMTLSGVFREEIGYD